MHRIFGPGLLESVYRECLIIELTREHLRVESERSVPLEYKGQRNKGTLKLDLLVEGCVIVELKAVDRKLTGCPAGLLMNFNAASLRAGLRRLNHPDIHVKKTS